MKNIILILFITGCSSPQYKVKINSLNPNTNLPESEFQDIDALQPPRTLRNRMFGYSTTLIIKFI
jgi:PBP1b-binding outer membrane lipoprotein LpoB